MCNDQKEAGQGVYRVRVGEWVRCGARYLMCNVANFIVRQMRVYGLR